MKEFLAMFVPKDVEDWLMFLCGGACSVLGLLLLFALAAL